jgi:hypothetical protein
MFDLCSDVELILRVRYEIESVVAEVMVRF